MRRVKLSTLVALVMALGCAPTSASRSGVAVVTVGEPAAGAATAARGRPGPREVAPVEAGFLRCGEARCDAATQVCCSFSGEQTCARKVPLAPTADPEHAARFEAQVKECSDTTASRYAFDQLTYCDDAGDCPSGAVCCSDPMWGDSGVAQCRPLPPDGRNPCGFYELCVEGTPCGTPGTVCRAGTCKLAVVELACGSQRCTAARPICCSSEDGGLECVPDADEACSTNAARLKVECRSRADCPGGMPCCSSVFSTYCAGECINAGYACNAAADCPPEDLGVKLNGCVDTPPDERPPHRRCDYGP